MDNLTNVTTGEVRLSFVHLFKPYAHQQGQDAKFSCTILLPKSDLTTKARIDAAINAATERGVSSKWNGVRPPVVPDPVYDGDGLKTDGTPYGSECRGHWVFTASSPEDQPPEVVDLQGNRILNQSEIYSGVYAYVNVNFAPYAFGGKKGVGCYLGPVMKTRDGESLGGSAIPAAQAFAGLQQLQVPQQTYTQPAPQQAYTQPVPQQTYTQPAQQQAYAQPGYPQPAQAINPITGLPM